MYPKQVEKCDICREMEIADTTKANIIWTDVLSDLYTVQTNE